MSPGQPDTTVVRRHLLALDEAVQHLRRHAGRPFSVLVADPDERKEATPAALSTAPDILLRYVGVRR